ncbi:DHH family phosphoesterase [Patescibacteria group bacterium]|nr:DHH family phosphoesterase [Patescibacteria group bacterium]
MAIKNLDKAAARLKKAVKKGERIILYGDADLDGVCSAIIMQETLKSLGGNVVRVYFPDRENDGYGITLKALKELKTFSPALLCAMDLGISNFKEIKEAKKQGFDVILVDHHVVLGKLPDADIIVDPKQEGDTHPFKELAACGLTFRLAEEILKDKMSSALRKSLVELAAIGTIADMMVREQDNIEIIEEGMETLENSWRPGVRAFFGLQELEKFPNIESKLQKMISILNVRDVEDGYPASFRILSSDSEKEVILIAQRLLKVHELRRQERDRLLVKVRNSISEKKNESIVFEGGEDFEYILLGGLASIISQEEKKPTFMYRKMKKECVGSVRAPLGQDTVEAMKHCKEYTITYGGHPQASGFRVENKNLARFKNCLLEYFNNLSA